MTTTSDQHPTDLREYLRVLRARKVEIVIVTAVLVAATMFFTFRQTPIYEGSTKVLVKPVVNPTATGAIPQQPNLDTERELVLSQVVAQKVQHDAHVGIPVDTLLKHVKVQVVTDTEVMDVRYDDPVPATAARLANAFAAAYVDFRSQQALDQFQAASTAVQRRVDGIQASLATLNKKIQSTTDPSTKDALQAQRDTFVAQLAVLQQRLLDLQSNASVAQGSAEIVQQAEVPKSPVSPNKVRNGILAVFAGLALGIGLAFLRERLDDRIKSREDLERRLRAPVLATVPSIPGWRGRSNGPVITRSDPTGPGTEAYRTLATNIRYIASRQPLKVLMVTSAVAGEGKTMTSSNLAMALARSNERVILVSADLRRPRTHIFLGLDNQFGMSNFLADGRSLEEVVKRSGVTNLLVITGGPVPQDPASLLGGLRAAEFFKAIRELADIIVVDTPPVLAVADASIVAPFVDGTLFIVDTQKSNKSAIDLACDQLQNAGATVVGGVYNNLAPGQGPYRAYYEYYSSEEHPTNANGRRHGRHLEYHSPQPSGGSWLDEWSYRSSDR